MWPEPYPYRAALEAWLKDNNVSLPIMSMASYSTIIGCVSAGSGMSLVPKGVFEQYRTGMDLVGYQFPALEPIANHFIWRNDSEPFPALEAFIKIIKPH